MSVEPSEIIQLREVSFRYPKSNEEILRCITLDVVAGRCFGLLGPNGAGKTTLLSILVGLNEPTSGHYFLNGSDTTHSSSSIKDNCSIVPQEYAFYPNLSGKENLEYFAGLHGLVDPVKKARINEVVEIAGLQSVLNTPAKNYSGGVKRRLNLAIGLLNDPKVLFLDEPTVGIDAQSRQFILDSISQLKHSGMTIIYTSHYMEEVQAICDDVAIIDGGSVVVQSSLQALVEEASKKVYTIVVDKAFAPENRFEPLDCDITQIAPNTLRIEFRNLSVGVPELFRALKEGGYQIEDLSKERSSLEQIYLDLTKKDLRE